MVKNNKDAGLDPILAQLGNFGKFNIINYVLLLFPAYLAGLFGPAYVFEAPDLSYRCRVPECENSEQNQSIWLTYAIPTEKDGTPSKCKRYSYKENASDTTCSEDQFDTSVEEDCSAIVYSDEDSAVKDFNLGCQDWKRTLIGSIHNAALFVCLPITGIISDRYGRKVALSAASLMNGIFGFLRSYSTDYTMMLICIFMESCLGGGAYGTAFVLAMEVVSPKARVMGNTLVNIVYAIGLMTLAALAWYLQSWRVLLKVMYLPAILAFSYLWILNESVRWLLNKGRNNEATDILKKAAKMNKVDLPKEILLPFYELEKPVPASDEKNKSNEKNENKEESFKKVIKSKIIMIRVFVCSFLWITCSFVYNGLSINSVSLAGNKYVNFMLVSFVEIPANIVCLFVQDRFGRKKTMITTYVLNACLCISLSLLPKGQKWWALALYLSGKFSITVAYSTVYIYVSEVFPTSARQCLLSVCSSLGRVGSTLAPFTPLLALYHANLPAIFFSSLSLVASVLVFTLPETINVPLPDTIEEAERMTRRKTHGNTA